MTNITENTNTTAYLYIVVCGNFRCTCSAFQGTVVDDLDRVPYKVLVNDETVVVIMARGKVIGICPITDEEIDPEDIPAPFVNGGLDKVIDDITTK